MLQEKYNIPKFTHSRIWTTVPTCNCDFSTSATWWLEYNNVLTQIVPIVGFVKGQFHCRPHEF